jgi:hypothetical protein
MQYFSLPLARGQLYTPYDLKFKAWQDRLKTKKATTKYITEDPFVKINVDPLEEFKVSRTIMFISN